MLKQLSLCLFLFCISNLLIGQANIPVLRTTETVLSIKDGEELRKDYWTISPEIELDVYTADKTNEVKVVTFYSNIDSISFELRPREKYDFVILLNEKDSCFTQLKSGTKELGVLSKSEAHIKDTIPFTLTAYNNISIRTIINKIDTVNLMFHTSVNSISLTEKATKRMSSINLGDSSEVKSWGGEGSSRYGRNNIVRIGQMKWEGVTIWEDKHSGRLTDGKFGPHLFADKIIEIDYDKSLLILHNSLPEIGENYEKLNIDFKRSLMFIEGLLKIGKNVYVNKFLIHSGYSGTLLLDDEFVRNHKLGEKLLTIKENELRDSYGNILKVKKVRLPKLVIGSTVFEELPLGFFEGAIGRQKISVLGADLLKRFNMLIDMGRANIYLKPNNLLELPYSEA